MSFRAINEIENFNFKDCELVSIQLDGNRLVMELEALIVMPANSQNSNFTESYAGTVTAEFEGVQILRSIKEGYKYYDANDVLKKVVPDEELSPEQLQELLISCKQDGVYLFALAKEEKGAPGIYTYSAGIELNEEDTYWICFSFEKSIFSWDKYMNRVQAF